MKINHIIKIQLVLFVFGSFVACSSSNELALIEADYEAGILTLEQRDEAIAAHMEKERVEREARRAAREEQQSEDARRRAANIRLW